MGLRSRTRYVKKLKRRRCPRCRGRVGRHQVRCRRCHREQQPLKP